MIGSAHEQRRKHVIMPRASAASTEMTDISNPCEVLSTRRFYDCKYYAAEEDQLLHKSGDIRPYSAIRCHYYGVTVLPIDDEGCTTIVGQFRHPHGRYTWETVRGVGDLDAPPIVSAKRELEEETGYQAEHWLQLFDLMASPGMTSERAPAFIAWGLRQGRPNPDSHEYIDRHRIPFRQALDWVFEGKIVDAASVALILGVQIKMTRSELPEDLLRRFR